MEEHKKLSEFAQRSNVFTVAALTEVFKAAKNILHIVHCTYTVQFACYILFVFLYSSSTPYDGLFFGHA